MLAPRTLNNTDPDLRDAMRSKILMNHRRNVIPVNVPPPPSSDHGCPHDCNCATCRHHAARVIDPDGHLPPMWHMSSARHHETNQFDRMQPWEQSNSLYADLYTPNADPSKLVTRSKSKYQRPKQDIKSLFDDGKRAFGAADGVVVGHMVDPRTGAEYDVYEPEALPPNGDFRVSESGHQRVFDDMFGGFAPGTPYPKRREIVDEKVVAPFAYRDDPEARGRQRDAEVMRIYEFHGPHADEHAWTDPEGYHKIVERPWQDGLNDDSGPRMLPMPYLTHWGGVDPMRQTGTGMDAPGAMGIDGPRGQPSVMRVRAEPAYSQTPHIGRGASSQVPGPGMRPEKLGIIQKDDQPFVRTTGADNAAQYGSSMKPETVNKAKHDMDSVALLVGARIAGTDQAQFTGPRAGVDRVGARLNDDSKFLMQLGKAYMGIGREDLDGPRPTLLSKEHLRLRDHDVWQVMRHAFSGADNVAEYGGFTDDGLELDTSRWHNERILHRSLGGLGRLVDGVDGPGPSPGHVTKSRFPEHVHSRVAGIQLETPVEGHVFTKRDTTLPRKAEMLPGKSSWARGANFTDFGFSKNREALDPHVENLLQELTTR